MPSCLDSYHPDAARFDELLNAEGQPRAHWQPLVKRIDASSPDTVRRGVELTRRLVIENGVTYNVYADPQGRDRPWALDPLPFVISAQEWQAIEAGVAQRARLLDALLKDVYGPQRLLREGIIPPEIPFGHPNFLWPCCDVQQPEQRALHVYAVDVARASDGRWWVLGDRTQTPSGPGYALENRRIISRVYADLIDEMSVRSLSGFFAALREGMMVHVEEGEQPLAVVLTPGPYNETYFEHAYLARQLGFALVEGHDLTVRGDTLYLKTLAGLKRVHAIFRRLDDDFCDPAELRADSALGVPGLLQVVRANRVLIANSLGSGVLESAAWLGFLPAASRWLFDENLILPSLATWWCGERPALEYVLAHLDELVLKSTYPNQSFEPVFARDLDKPARAALIERLRARPYAYVAQERIALSQAPAWRNNGFAERAIAIRVYATATAKGYQVLPGGLARIGSDAYEEVVSNQRGGGSKDIWVLAAPDDSVEMADLAIAPRLKGRNEDLPSRIAENLFWMGRYSERCEVKARVLRGTLSIERRSLAALRATEFCYRFGIALPDTSLSASVFDGDNPLGLPQDLRRLEWSGTQVRSRLSSEHWRALGAVQRQFHAAAERAYDSHETLDRLLLGLAGLAGLALDDMIQDDGWRLLTLGRRLERVSFLCLLFNDYLALGDMPLRPDLEWLLDIASSTITYRTRYSDRAHLATVLNLLVCDTTNPHAIAQQCAGIRETLAALARSAPGVSIDAFERAALDVIDADLGRLEGTGRSAVGARKAYARTLSALSEATSQLSDRLSMRHFSHTDQDLHMVAA